MTFEPFDESKLKDGLYWLAVNRPDEQVFIKNSGTEIKLVKQHTSLHIVLSRVFLNNEQQWVFEEVANGLHGKVEKGDVVTKACELRKPSLALVM
ncbi:hypothetical protein D3C87_504590 [compost metagenome]